MENIIELTEQEINDINGGSWLAIGLMLVSPAIGLFALGVEHGYRGAAK